MSLSRRSVLSALGSMPLATLAPRTQAQDGPLRLSTGYADGVFHTQNARDFAARLAPLGRPIEVVSNSALMPMADVPAALGRGEIAFGELIMSGVAGQYPLLGIDALPFIVRGFDDAARMREASRQPIEALLLSQGVRLLYTTPWPPQGLYSRRPVERLGDLKGLKLRVYNDATRRLAELSGAQPVEIGAHDLPGAIERGGVDAMLTSSTTGVDSQAWKAMKVFVDIRAWIPKNMMCMSERLWQSLDEAGRTTILQAAAQAEKDGWRLGREADETGKRVLTDHQMQVTEASPELRRSLDLMGERFGREWAGKAGVVGASTLLAYYNLRGL